MRGRPAPSDQFKGTPAEALRAADRDYGVVITRGKHAGKKATIVEWGNCGTKATLLLANGIVLLASVEHFAIVDRYCPGKTPMHGSDEAMREYVNGASVEQLLLVREMVRCELHRRKETR